jgi:hypothetical protein
MRAAVDHICNEQHASIATIARQALAMYIKLYHENYATKGETLSVTTTTKPSIPDKPIKLT